MTPTAQIDAQKWIAPCGLNCYTCSGSKNGIIVKHATIVQKYLKGFASFAPFLAGFNPIYKDYSAFDAILNDLVNGRCEGCQSGHCVNESCGIFKCSSRPKNGTCADCVKFPCNPENVDDSLRQTWINGITDIQNHGLISHWNSTKGKAHFDKEN